MDVNEITAESLDNLRHQTERTALAVVELRKEFRAVWSRLEDEVKAYQKRRNQLFVQEATRRGLTWCTSCLRMIPLEDYKLIVEEGTIEVHGEYTGDWDVPFKHISRFCYDCCDAILEGGYRGGASRFWEVKEENGVFLDSNGKAVTDIQRAHGVLSLTTPPLVLFRELSTAYGIPSEVKLSYRDDLEKHRELIVDDEVVVAKIPNQYSIL
ncbi:MAG: hypothetical protein M1153_01955 [Patescibacteria group bacterium]|nr:hypothetical protein [Patescibacteria group bacterium]